MTRNEIRKQKYRVLKNYLGDTTLAKQVREWSSERIYNEFGLVIDNKKIPELKKSSERSYAVRETLVEKYRLAREKGFYNDEALKVRRMKKDDIISKSPFVNRTPFDMYERNTKKEMKETWAEWSMKGNEIPEIIRDLAERVNLKFGFDSDSKYGFAVVYYAYIKEKTIEEILPNIKPDKFARGELYETAKTL